jgi:hypothetical protein
VPTKKQRRRRQKTRRHDWEYVYVDEEGREVEVDPGELRPTKKSDDGAKKAAPAARGGSTSRARGGRAIEPPSWRRVFRRAAIFAPIFIVVLLLLNPHGSILARVGAAIPLLVFFIPFSYFTDSLAYRTYRKRLERVQGASANGKPKPRPR